MKLSQVHGTNLAKNLLKLSKQALYTKLIHVLQCVEEPLFIVTKNRRLEIIQNSLCSPQSKQPETAVLNCQHILWEKAKTTPW